MRNVLLAAACVFFGGDLLSQCCSAGSGSPIAGGTSQGVLQEKQVELNLNFQNVFTDVYYKGSERLTDTAASFNSNYLYFRSAFGLYKRLTLSLESGYYINRTDQVNDSFAYESKGIGDLIIFPRYEVYNNACDKSKSEIVLGLGFKIPLGKYNDSIGVLEPFSGQVFYYTMPPAVQPSTGSHDLIFYAFYFREHVKTGIKFFASGLHVKKGWNPLGEKFGDYSSLGLFVSKVFKKKLGVTLQAKMENVTRMKYNENVALMGAFLYDVDATGSEKIFLVPQVSYGLLKGKVTLYAMSEFPIYQHLTKTQLGSKSMITAGVSWRFFATKPFTKKES